MTGAPVAASCRWLREREGGAEEAARSGEVEGETSWDGGGLGNEQVWWPWNSIGGHGGVHALCTHDTNG